MSEQAELQRLERAARSVVVRLRLRRGLFALLAWLPLPLGLGAALLGVVKIWRLDMASARPWFWALALPLAVVIAVALRAAFRAGSRWEGALALDRHHRLQDRTTSALAFAELSAEERSPLMDAAIADAVERARELDPSRAVPFSVPGEAWTSLALLLGIAGLSAFEVRLERVIPPPAPQLQTTLLGADDVALFREIGQELAKAGDAPELTAAAAKFNQLIEDMAEKRVDRREAFERLGDLERELSQSSELDEQAQSEGLKGVARELERSGLTKKAAEALTETRLEDAEHALRELAERLKRKEAPPTKAELEQLRKALEKAAAAANERQEDLTRQAEQLEEEQKSLLKKKQQGQNAEKTEQKLGENRRKLERLGREKERAARAKQQLSELDRKLAEAARDVLDQTAKSAEGLESAAEDLNRMARKQLTDQQKQEMLKRLEELRELLRQQGKSGKDQQERLQRFGQRARGAGQPGQPGGAPSKGSQPGQLRLSRGDGSGPSIDIPMPGAGTSAGQGQGQTPGQGEGNGAQAGKAAGQGHDSKIAGAATDLKGKTQDVTAAAQDTGQGAASAEVIYGAAERGFVGKGYTKVFTDYQTVAERVMNQDEIPPGYRFYVRRYFQLIRPRD